MASDAVDRPNASEIDARLRSRRAVLAAALGGVGGLAAIALGRPRSAAAAAGGAMILGAANDSGTAQTTLTNAGLGAAFTLKTTNGSTGAAGIFGWSSQTGSNATRGVYGRADGPNSHGVLGRQVGAVGSGAAVMAEGNSNTGLVATAAGPAPALVATHTGVAPGTKALFAEVDAIGPGPGSAAIHGRIHSTIAGGVAAIVGEVVGGPSIGVAGQSFNGTGVFGLTGGGEGVHGEALDGMAVGAAATSGTGLHAQATTGTAIHAVSDSGTAALIDGHIELTEISVPLAPAGAARLFVRDPGTGKTQLCVKFPDNSLVVLASEA